MDIKRGDIFYADLSPVVGSEQGGVRPVLIIQNNVGNRYSPTIIAGAITSQLTKAKLPTHIEISKGQFGLRTLDKRRLREKLGSLDRDTIRKVDKAILISLGFAENY